MLNVFSYYRMCSVTIECVPLMAAELRCVGLSFEDDGDDDVMMM